MKIIKKEYLIDAAVEKVWQALVDPKIIERWGGGPAKMNAKVGFKFSLWRGDIYGTNTKVIENKLLEQDWFGGDWSEPSKVRFELISKDSQTKLVLINKNIPPEEFDNISKGWDDYYLGPMKDYLEE